MENAFNGFRIAQVSELHNAVFGEDNAELLQILSECEPNVSSYRTVYNL